MIERFHGIDRHKRSSTISVLNRAGEEVRLISACRDLSVYIETLGSQDAVVLEASSGAFWWADRIEARGAECHILDPFRFKIIRDSWTETDKRDARNMARALWVMRISGEFGLPTVYKPQALIRELRKLFSAYTLVSRQATMHKNAIQPAFVENGIVLSEAQKAALFGSARGQALLAKLERAKQQLWEEIVLAGEPLKEKVRLLLTLRGVSPLTALAFLADIGDIRRFRSTKKMSAYLGLAPRMRESGGKGYAGHISRVSRWLTRTILTQSIVHLTAASPRFGRQYAALKLIRGSG